MLGNKGYLFSAGHLHSDMKIAHCKAEKLKLLKIKAWEDTCVPVAFLSRCPNTHYNRAGYTNSVNYLFNPLFENMLI